MSELVPEEVTHGDNVVVTRRSLLIAGAVVTVALILVIAGGVYLAVQIGGVSSDNSRALDGLRAITKPTPAEYRAQLRRGFRLCSSEPRCVTILRRLLHQSSGASARRPRGGATTPGTRPTSPTPPPSDGGGGADRPPAGETGPAGPPGQPGAPGQPAPAAPIEIPSLPCLPLVCPNRHGIRPPA